MSGYNSRMTDKVRIDKWLWAARFFRTRALARDAIKGGKVQIDGQAFAGQQFILRVRALSRVGHDQGRT